MGLNVKEEVLHVETLVGDNSSQIVLQTTLDLPSSSPSIGRIVVVKGNMVINDLAVTADKVNFDGYIDLKLIYVADDYDIGPPSYQVIPFRQAIAFSDYVEVIGADEEMVAHIKADLLGIEWELQADQRAVNIDVLAQFLAIVKQKNTLQVVTNATIQPPKKLAVEDGNFTIQAHLESVTGSATVDQELTLPDGMGPISAILDHVARPRLDETKIGSEQILLNGNLDLDLLYLDEDGNVQSWTFENVFPFKINVLNETQNTDLVARSELTVDSRVELSAPSVSFILGGDIRAKLDLYESKQMRIVFDLAGSGGSVVETRTEEMMFDNLVNEKVQQASAQGVIELGGNYPPIREIVGSEAKILTSNIRVDDDKVFVEGTINVELAYLAHTEEDHKPLYWVSFPNAVTFQQVIAIGGVSPGMIGDLDIDVVQLGLDLINRETIEVDTTFRSNLRVTEPINQSMLVEAIEVPMVEEEAPSVTYVFVRDNDTLWKLSRIYHSSVESIVEANSWLREREQMKLIPGDRLCIPRKIY